MSGIPYRGKFRRGKVMKFWPSDEYFSPTKNFVYESIKEIDQSDENLIFPAKFFPDENFPDKVLRRYI